MHPVSTISQATCPDTKLLVNLLSGGKANGAAMKFANFYLIIDGKANPETNIPNAFKLFLAQLKTKFVAGKGGDTAFKLLADGSHFNAFASINDSFKVIEEAIAASEANGSRTKTNMESNRGGTALSGKSKTERSNAVRESQDQAAALSPEASLQQEQVPIKNVFTIGLNCDADALFNKDAKDPNKYEIEGVKTQSSTQQLIEYYIKLI